VANARLAIGIDHRRLLKPGVSRELRMYPRPRGIRGPRRDRDLRNPILQPLHCLIVAFRNFGFDTTRSFSAEKTLSTW